MNWLTRAWRGHGPASSGFGLLVLGCVFLAVAGPRADLALRTRALQQSLNTATPVARSVYGTMDDTGFNADLGELPSAKPLATVGTLLRSNLMRDRLPLAGAADDWSGLASSFFTVSSGLARAVSGPPPPQLELVYRQPLARYATVVAGQLPATARLSGNHGTFEVAVTSATAARFGLHPGSRIQAQAGTGITLVVTGIVRPAQTNAAFWSADPALAAPALTGSTPYWAGAAMVGAAELPLIQQLLDRASITVSWDFPLATGSITADNAATLSGELGRAVSLGGLFSAGTGLFSARTTLPATVTSGLTALLGNFIPADQSASTVLRLLAVSLAVIAIAVVLLGGQLMARRRRGELSLLGARGASRTQVTLLALRAAAVGALGGAAAGTALAIAATPGHQDTLSWWLGGATLLAALACPPAIIWWEQRKPGTPALAREADGEGGPTSRRAAWRRVAAEVTLIAVAVAGIVVLRQQSAGAYSSLAPVLVAVPAAIVVMRCYPLAVRGLLRLAGLRPGVAAFTGLARAAQGSPGTLMPGFALVLALTVAAFGVMVRDAVTVGQTMVSWQQTGADAAVNAQLAYQAPGPAAVRAISAVPGVRHVALATFTSGSVPTAQWPVPVLAVSPAQYAALVADTPLGAFPAGELADAGNGSTGGAVPALATPAAVADLGGVRTLEVAQQTVHITVKEEIPGIAGISGGTPAALNGAIGAPGEQTDGILIVLPSWALAGRAASEVKPNLVLVAGADLDGPRLEAVIRTDLPGATVALRSTAAAALANSPLPRDEYLAIVAGSVAAAGLTMLVLLIAVAGAARSRRATIARLRMMGASIRQARWIELAETLPLVVAAAAGGVVCAWALGPLIGPALNLSAFTGGGVTVPVGARWAPLAAAAGGLVVLTLLALAVEAATSRNKEESR
jgi:putative ABC transport system permease protein